ncbi:MAG: hypothetical protein RLO46_23605 [Pseudomonadales bacterium]
MAPNPEQRPRPSRLYRTMLVLSVVLGIAALGWWAGRAFGAV